MTILTALGNLLAILPKEETYLALFHGVRRIAADRDGAAPRRQRSALTSRPDPHYAQAVATALGGRPSSRGSRANSTYRHLDGRSAGGPGRPAIRAETDRVFADSGHSLDFINKALECLDLIGWQHAADVLPTVIGQMVAARGADESAEWRQPADLIALCEKAATDLPALFAVGRDRGPWLQHAELDHAPADGHFQPPNPHRDVGSPPAYRSATAIPHPARRAASKGQSPAPGQSGSTAGRWSPAAPPPPV